MRLGLPFGDSVGDPSVPPSGKLDIPMDEGPTNSKSPPKVENALAAPTTAPSGSGGDFPMALAPPINNPPAKREVPDAASSGDEARFAAARTGEKCLQAGRLCHEKLLEAEKDAILGIPRLSTADANEEGGTEQYGS